MNIVPFILSSLIGGLIVLGSFFTYQRPAILPDGYATLEEYLSERGQAETLGATATKPAGLFTYRISGSGVSSSATSFTLTSLTLPQNDYPIQDSDLSDTFYLTFEPGSTDRQEFISCTTIGTNTGGSVAISGCTRGIAPITPFTASTTLQFAHSGGSAVIFSDSPSLLNEYAAKGNSESITAGWVFASTSGNLPGYISLPSNLSASSTAFASVSFAQNLASQGAATSTESVGGIVELATQIEMASSTDLGADRPLVLQAKYATSSPDVRGLYVPVAQNDGYLKQSWLDLTKHWLFSSLFATNASSTNATSTAFAVTGAGVHIAGQDYRFPANDGTASSTVIMTDGSGNLSWIPVLPLVLSDYTTRTVTMTSAAQSYTMRATYGVGTFTASTSDSYRVMMHMGVDSSSGTETMQMIIGNGTASTTVVSIAQAATYADVVCEINIFLKGATNNWDNTAICTSDSNTLLQSSVAGNSTVQLSNGFNIVASSTNSTQGTRTGTSNYLRVERIR